MSDDNRFSGDPIEAQLYWMRDRMHDRMQKEAGIQPDDDPNPTTFAILGRPGSYEATRRGCLCPVIDNHCGRGRGGDGELYGWYVSGECPMHGEQDADNPNPTMFYFNVNPAPPTTFGFSGFTKTPLKRDDEDGKDKPCTDPGGHLWEERAYTLLVVGGGKVSDCIHCSATTTRFGKVPPPRRWRDPK